MLTFTVFLYTSHARESIAPVSVEETVSVETSGRAKGFSWEISVEPNIDTGEIVAMKYLWLVDEEWKKIPRTQYDYEMECVKGGVAPGKDVFVDAEEEVIKFTGAYLRCIEDPAHFEDFKDKVSNRITITCPDEGCLAPVESLYVDAVFKPDSQSPNTNLLEYRGFEDQEFVISANGSYLVWAFSNAVTWIPHSWGNSSTNLYADIACSDTPSECTMQYIIDGGEFQTPAFSGTTPDNFYHKVKEHNLFYIGNNFYGELKHLKFDPGSCPGCIPPN